MGACCVILAHVTWALAWEWALSIQAAKTVTWVTYLGVGTCPGHYGNSDPKVNLYRINFYHTICCYAQSARTQKKNLSRDPFFYKFAYHISLNYSGP